MKTLFVCNANLSNNLIPCYYIKFENTGIDDPRDYFNFQTVYNTSQLHLV